MRMQYKNYDIFGLRLNNNKDNKPLVSVEGQLIDKFRCNGTATPNKPPYHFPEKLYITDNEDQAIRCYIRFLENEYKEYLQ